MAYGEFYVERQGWARFPKVLIMCRKHGRMENGNCAVERRRYVPERTCRITEYDEAPFPVCSECGAVQPDDFTVYYCWNCGARVVE